MHVMVSTMVLILVQRIVVTFLHQATGLWSIQTGSKFESRFYSKDSRVAEDDFMLVLLE